MAADKYRNRNRMNAGSYYTYGNVAYELQPDYSPYRFREEEEERRKEEARLAKAEARESRISSITSRYHLCTEALVSVSSAENGSSRRATS